MLMGMRTGIEPGMRMMRNVYKDESQIEVVVVSEREAAFHLRVNL